MTEPAVVPPVVPTPEPLVVPPVVPPVVVAPPAVETILTPAQVAPVVTPEVKLELKLPENSLLDQARVDQIKTFAKEKNLTSDQAQMIVDRENEAMGSYKTAQEKAFSDEKSKWVDEIKSDPEFLGEKFNQSTELAHRAAKHYLTPADLKVLNDTGLGNHPILVRAFHKIGKDMGEDKLILAPPVGPGKKSAAEVLYGAKE